MADKQAFNNPPPGAYGTQPQGYPPQTAAGYAGPPQQGGYPAPQPGFVGASGPPGGAPYPGQPYPGQPSAGQPYPGQLYPAQPYQAQPYQGQPNAPPAGAHGMPAGAVPGPPPAEAPLWQGDVPGEDVEDNPNAAEPQPSAPPLDKMDNIGGYSNITFSDALLPPPSYDEAVQGREPQDRRPVGNIPSLTEEQAREALVQFVSENCCYGSGAAKDMKFTDLRSSSAFHYTLETFCESRSTAWTVEPYTGQPIDSPMNGPAPLPWDVPANPPQRFQDQVAHLEVPHTASVKPCHQCIGNGRVRCHRCFGRGCTRCSSCHGRGHSTHYHDGHHEHRSCTWCHGSGRRRCTVCHGHGQIACKTCGARGQVKCYIKLTINWTNNKLDHIVERTSLPDELIRGVTGQQAFEEVLPRVWPINHFPDQSINAASKQLVDKHATGFPTSKILLQRQIVRIVPVTEAFYEWKDKQQSFLVYGFEHKVYAPNYPQKCCCGCTIL